jgi:hypothetical protein
VPASRRRDDGPAGPSPAGSPAGSRLGGCRHVGGDVWATG